MCIFLFFLQLRMKVTKGFRGYLFDFRMMYFLT
jgi:hypothetical protein